MQNYIKEMEQLRASASLGIGRNAIRN